MHRIGFVFFAFFFLVGSCSTSLDGTAQEIVKCINELDEEVKPYSKYQVSSDSIKVIYGYLHPDHMQKYYDTTLVLEQSECDVIIVDYNNSERVISKIECSHLDYSTISFEKTIFKRSENINFKVLGCGEGSIFSSCFVKIW